ncbi:hypothetical protein [Aliiruegeria lutimaris]|uniref:Uncharacterized protein n=1 Tax=Aliiruegeria lutimaris TaxID=571298 RepID=A0A1G8JTE4_9RHOB|nr:hypothetical protein [Aliiruegeria lutimaris]SDI34363.1 hypothetical protein SAMN04488026_100256 [Aliiruegeria lutimaris]
MSTYLSSLAAAALLFGLSTYFGVFVLESLIRRREAQREAQVESASHVRAQGRWLAPTVWILTVFWLALFVGYFIASTTPPNGSLKHFNTRDLPRPAV